MQKPLYTTSIVPVFVNETIPAGLLLKLLTENRSAIGFTVQKDGKLDIEKFEEMDPIEDEVKEWTKNLENTKKFNRKICFHSFPEKFDPAEIQPWTILRNSKNEPILVLSCEGDFFDHTSPDHSEFFNLVNDYLGPQIEEMYALLNNDVKKVMAWLQTSGFHHNLDKHFGERAVFEFMTTEGLPYTYGKNKIGGEFSWGRASNVYGYSESAQEAASPAPAEEVKKNSKYSDASETPAPDKPVTIPPRADPPKGDPIAAAAAEVPQKRRVVIPVDYHGKRKKAFIRATLGSLPDNWDTLKHLDVDVQTSVKSLADLDKTAAADIKDMKGSVSKPAEVPAERVVPVISGAEQAQVTAFIKKYLDGSSNRIENPLEIQKIEAKLPVFTELAAMTSGLDDIDTWSASVMNTFIKERPEAAWLLMLEFRADRRKRKQLMLLSDKKLSDLTGTEVPAAEPEKIVPSEPKVVPQTEVPYKKSKYA